MLTQDDIDAFAQEQGEKTKKLIIETMQFFEIDIPVSMDAEEFVNSQVCRELCADKIQSGLTDLKLERIE